ncbi:3-ketoacyl-(acyl-carrier-protein) reductase [Brachyspira intermedia PWS/A]|uniref:3-ketoacyl-(Acyl-carrier-protein) reductase n=1 Tax=Brachyspira intermedia (strain ATCC 51140 / PWS/A) TaxID=1045858 RepID=G0EKB2_BRAIP|nr:SDR family oxidoreductase [Brachyspira intermedia]AEM21300.1 3-ketoacyl-(acyl-carrier-protein) reductase [Brachyspira intermedia PWS/A]
MSSKICIITGASNGIGKEIALLFAKNNCDIAFIDKDNENGLKLQKQIKDMGRECLFINDNIDNEKSIKSFTNKIIEKFGNVDYLINNACYSNKGLLSNCSYDDFLEIFKIGAAAPYEITKNLMNNFNEKAGIINIASTRAFMSQKDSESYSAAKGAIIALTHAMAISLSHKVRVNSISPGWINTIDDASFSKEDILQHPSAKVGNTSDIASTAWFLCNNDFINGENITVDGGMTKLMIYHNDEGWKLDI